MNYELLKLLKDRNDYVSGEEISKQFNVTRSSIWKHIKSLKDQGYEIEGVSRKGYKLISSPDKVLPFEITENLNTKIIAQKILHFDEIDSTNIKAKSLANNNEDDGTLIISEKQIGGHGRFTRPWSSPEGGLWFSLILRPHIEPIYSSKITQVAAAAIITTLKQYNIDALIKWPNDIYINGKKICGILTEMKCDMDRVDYVIPGIGINVNIPSFPEELSNKASSLLIEAETIFDRAKLLAEILNNFEILYLELINNHNFKPSLDICRNNSFIINKQAYWVTTAGKQKVTCVGIDDEGALIVKLENGEKKSVISGEITFSSI